MKTLDTKLSESSQHEAQTAENDTPIGEVSWVRRGPLTPDEIAEQKKRLQALAETPDEDIDYSDIPSHTEEQLRKFVRGPWTERVERAVTLKVDDEVAAWLEGNAVKQSYLINLLLKREAQRETVEGVGEMGKAS